MEYDIHYVLVGVVAVLVLALVFRRVVRLWQELWPLVNTVQAVRTGSEYLGLLLLVGGLFSLVAFSVLSQASSAAVPTQTRTPWRPTLVPSETRTPRPSQTAAPTRLHGCVTNSTVRVRQGPGADYPVIAGMAAGTCMTVLGRNAQSTWVYITTADKTGWVSVSLLTIEGNLKKVPMMTVSNSTPMIATNAAPSPTRKLTILATGTP